jgi:hypothetical protein
MAMLATVADFALGEDKLYWKVLNALLGAWSNASATIRHRLCERVFAIQYPNAPLDVMAWLARLEVLTPAKYTGPHTINRALDSVSLRAMSLWELDTWRQWSYNLVEGADNTLALRVVMGYERDAVSPHALERVWDATQRAQKAATAHKDKGPHLLLESSWHDRQYIHETLLRLRTRAPWLRGNLHKQSSAVSDIATAFLGWCKRAEPELVLFSADTERDSLANEVKLGLKSRGFTMNAQTIYRRYTTAHQQHLSSLRYYYGLQKETGTTGPVDHLDYFQLNEVALLT